MFITTSSGTKRFILLILVLIAFGTQWLTEAGAELAIIFLWIYTIVNVSVKSDDGTF